MNHGICKFALLVLITCSEWNHSFAVTNTGLVPDGHEVPFLESVAVELNGERVDVANGKTLKVILGDVLVLKSALLLDHSSNPEKIDFRGYRHGGQPDSADDRGFAIRTDKDLELGKSADGRGYTYFVAVKSGKNEHGRVRIEIDPPKLESITLEVNGHQRQVNEGEPLYLQGTDQIKMIGIKTNMNLIDDDITFRLISVHESGKDLKEPAGKKYEMQLMRRQRIFARVPVTLAPR